MYDSIWWIAWGVSQAVILLVDCLIGPCAPPSTTPAQPPPTPPAIVELVQMPEWEADGVEVAELPQPGIEEGRQ